MGHFLRWSSLFSDDCNFGQIDKTNQDRALLEWQRTHSKFCHLSIPWVSLTDMGFCEGWGLCIPDRRCCESESGKDGIWWRMEWKDGGKRRSWGWSQLLSIIIHGYASFRKGSTVMGDALREIFSSVNQNVSCMYIPSPHQEWETSLAWQFRFLRMVSSLPLSLSVPPFLFSEVGEVDDPRIIGVRKRWRGRGRRGKTRCHGVEALGLNLAFVFQHWLRADAAFACFANIACPCQYQGGVRDGVIQIQQRYFSDGFFFSRERSSQLCWGHCGRSEILAKLMPPLPVLAV